ncbi:MAG: ABC transporter substrate-binding protein [Muribaculaceae bacterium]|nr:ABC transporter substrate-binding protein [Muribaculaceae bacterium]
MIHSTSSITSPATRHSAHRAPWLTPLFLTLAGIALLLASCTGSGGTTADYNVKVYEPAYASGFEILGQEGKQSTIIKVSSPWQGESTPARELFIQRDGEAVPSGFEGQIITGDAERIVCMSSTQIAMLQVVDASKNVVGVSGLDFITSQDIQSRRAEIGDVGYEGNIDYELLVSLKPDLVLLYGVFGPDPMEERLGQLGIPYMYVGEYVEESPLGKAEWMVAVAEALGKRQRAEEVFQPIPEMYENLKKTVAQSGRKAPKVMLNMPYRDSWFLPPSNSYLVTLVKDAGGEYIYKDNNTRSSKAIDMEEAYLLTSQADKWINLGSDMTTVADVKEALPKFANLPVVQQGELYNNTERTTAAGGNDFYESGVVNPDLVLRDMIKVLHPSLIDAPYTYYRQLPQQPQPAQPESSEE